MSRDMTMTITIVPLVIVLTSIIMLAPKLNLIWRNVLLISAWCGTQGIPLLQCPLLG